METIKFKVKATDLKDAFDIVSIVTPRPITNTGGTGYLFVVRGDRCYLYSRDTLRVARADFPITDVEGEGPFIYPAAYTKGFQYLGDQMLTFEAVHDGETHTVKYEGGDASARRASHDPRLMAGCDKDLEAATGERKFPVGLLKEALGLSKGFLAEVKDARAEEIYKVAQIFDKSNPATETGDGCLYAANSVQAFYFQSTAFEGRGLAIHGQHLPDLQAFLAKADGTEVTFRTGTNMTFVSDDHGRVLGWARNEKEHGRFSYMGLKHDKIVLRVPVFTMLNALNYIQTEMGDPKDRRDKIRVVYDSNAATITFTVSDGNTEAKSFPVLVLPQENSEKRDFAFNANINHITDLFKGAKANEVDFRICIRPADDKRPKEGAIFRTIDEFRMDAAGRVVLDVEGSIPCTVTRYVTSKD